MIKSLAIENFQSHPKSLFEFSPGLNCIVGSSDVGKSAALRSLNWIANNRPNGDFFRSYWGGDTSASIITEEGIEIKRTKTKSENIYSVDDKELKAIGKDIPAEVQEALQFTEINIQYQMDAPFLLSQSPGEIARYLNQIVNLENIHESMKRIESIRRQAMSKAEAASEQKASLTLRLEELPDLVYIEELIEKGERLEKSISEKEDSNGSIEKIISSLEYLEEHMGKGIDFNKARKLLQRCEDLRFSISDKEIENDSVDKVLYSLEAIDEELEDLSHFSRAKKTLTSYLERKEKLEELEEETTELENCINSLEAISSQIEENSKNVEGLKREFAESFPEICPLCGQEVHLEKC